MKSVFLCCLFGLLTLWCCKSVAPVTGSISSLTVPVPADNLLNERKIQLGKTLFFDQALSLDSSISCASCHIPELAFSDGLALSSGVAGRKANRNAPSLMNVAFSPVLMFDGEINTLEKQAGVPIQEHTEMDMDMRSLIKRLRQNPWYAAEAQAVFGREFDPFVLTRSLAAYERTLISADAPFDRFYFQGKKQALSREAQKGWYVFSEKLYCTSCHPPPFFSTYRPENNGLVLPHESDQGRWRIHYDSADRGRFKVPSLRNLALTAPYMHDGRMATLDEVIDFYSKGGNPVKYKHPKIQPFELSASERKALKRFLLEGLRDKTLPTR